MVKASHIQDRAEEFPDKEPLETFLSFQILGSSPGDADFPGTCASPIQYTHMLPRHIREDT